MHPSNSASNPNKSSESSSSTPLRNVLVIVSVTIILALFINAFVSYDLSHLKNFRSSSSSTSSLIDTLNGTITAILEEKLSSLLSAGSGPERNVADATTLQPTDSTTTSAQFDSELRWRQSQVNYSAVWMSDIEIDVLLRHLGNVDSYLEWGSGGSTLNFAQFAKQVAHSIEHDKTWCSEMQDEITKLAKLRNVIQYHCVPVKRGTNGWGNKTPFEEGNYATFKEYVDKISDLGVQTFDFILDDGRARIPAAVKALSYINENSVVVLHDAERAFKSQRDYHKIWNYYDPIDSVGGKERQGVVVLRRKPKYAYLEGNHRAVQNILQLEYSDV